MAIEPVIQEVATNLDEAATAVRLLDARVLSSFSFGVATGAVCGFMWGYRYNKEKLRAEIYKEAEAEIAEVREHYRNLTIAREAEKIKEPVEKIIQDRGYNVPEDEVVEEVERPYGRPLPAPVPIMSEAMSTHEWDYRTEQARRNPKLPYVIHQNEFEQEIPGYPKVEYHYYALDETLIDEDGSRISNVANTVGAEALQRFGHGSDDPNIVYVRNNRLQLHISVSRIPDRSYEEDVEGLSNEDDEPDDETG
jgi:hypothetical protein